MVPLNVYFAIVFSDYDYVQEDNLLLFSSCKYDSVEVVMMTVLCVFSSFYLSSFSF